MIKRVTLPLLRVVEATLAEPSGEHYGYALAKATGLSPATIQPILTRLERDGFLSARWEEIDPRVEGRRPRRLYRINGAAAEASLASLLAQHAQRRAPIGHPRLKQAPT